jgi:excinuclease ABC subunit C
MTGWPFWERKAGWGGEACEGGGIWVCHGAMERRDWGRMAGSPQRAKPDLKSKLHEVPHQPGVYLMRDRLDRVIYVGKARDLRKRLSHYFTPARSRMADLKTRALIESIWNFETHIVRNEAESLLLEGKLIKEYRPKYNVSFRDDKRFLLVRVRLEDAFPRFQLVRTRKEDGARYFGPFAHSGALRTTIHWMNKEFGLRSCRPLRPGESDYKHCSNDIIKNCSAPCIGKVSEEEYREQVEAACEFLKGHSREALKALEEEMKSAAGKLDFERAAHLRDMVDHLRTTLKPARRFRRGRGAPSTLKPLEDLQELGEVLHLGYPPFLMECFDISNISTTHCVASMVRFKDGVPDNANYRRYRIKTVVGQDDFASMAEVVRRRYSRILLEARQALGDEGADMTQETPLEAMRRLSREDDEKRGAGGKRKRFVRLPDLVIVDGGKGQLSSAVKELRRLGLHDLPVIGLAKQHEEIYRPGVPEPLILPHEMGALRLLQRIRDEAHRFANAYHQLLMKRRMAESVLDECPGVSQNRKELLLAQFGSVARLRRASAEEIAAIPGIGKKLAEGVVEFLSER